MSGELAGALVARIGKAHGIRGEVTVQSHTDSPQERFVPGVRFFTERAPGVAVPGPDELVLRTARPHNGVWLLGFEGVDDRTAAEALRGTRLMLMDADGVTDDNEQAWYEDELVGLAVEGPAGEVIGRVSALHTRPAQDLLEVTLTDGRTGLVPFVTALVPVVDVPGGRVVVDAPAGLFDLDD